MGFRSDVDYEKAKEDLICVVVRNGSSAHPVLR
jgi:hypothetical protein